MALTDAEIRQQAAELEAEQIRLAGDEPMEETELESITRGGHLATKKTGAARLSLEMFATLWH